MKNKRYRGRGIHNSHLFEHRVKPLVEYIVNNDKDLDIQIREDYINIYYKGGNICKVIGENRVEFDPFYFYQEPKPRHKSTDEIRGSKKKDIPRNEPLYRELVDKSKSLIQLLKDGKYGEYFAKAKEEMDKFWYSLGREDGERKDQQQISLNNRELSQNYIVLDVEYQVSDNSNFKYEGRLGSKKPRFDIIAIDTQSGQLIVIELKTGTKALYNPSGLDDHYECYNGSIGKNPDMFMAEMRFLLKQKQELGLLTKDIGIKVESPKFVFAFTPSLKETKTEKEQREEFEEEAKKIDSTIDRIVMESQSYILCK